MKTLNILFSGLTILSIAPSVFSQCANETNIYSFTYAGINYEIVKENQDWGFAAACAVERGGFLARIDSVEEQNAIFSAADMDAGIILANTVAPDGGGASYAWIAGTDKPIEGEWIWDGTDSGSGDQFWQGTSAATGGTPVGGLYSNWGDEPDDFGSGQDGLGLALTDWPLGLAGQWNDVASTNTLYYIIEYPDQSSIDENDEGSTFRIYPNPSKDLIIIKNESGSMLQTATIYYADGKKADIIESPHQIDISNYADGSYTIVFKFEDGSEKTEKFVK